jgi:hypothetical protein
VPTPTTIFILLLFGLHASLDKHNARRIKEMVKNGKLIRHTHTHCHLDREKSSLLRHVYKSAKNIFERKLNLLLGVQECLHISHLGTVGRFSTNLEANRINEWYKFIGKLPSDDIICKAFRLSCILQRTGEIFIHFFYFSRRQFEKVGMGRWKE